MGTATLDLDKWISQQKRTGEKVWLPLEGEGASGDVCVVVCWRYSEARAFSPFEDEPRVAAWQATLSLHLCDGVVVTHWSVPRRLPEGKEPNELRIGLFQATGLAVKDKALLFVPQSPIASRSTPHAIDAVDTRPAQVGRGLVGPADELRGTWHGSEMHLGHSQEVARSHVEAGDDVGTTQGARRRRARTERQVRGRRRGLGC